ncbi:AAA family ATPase [Natronosalvus amylolyticus]|uniref:AAA family ATPase n=1 Tax=Natronosalvus amylolyticus TaxID=2961994 RepID=UPI0020C95129|nr:AAA family ATPase [Natronosalvus amylolyticus]
MRIIDIEIEGYKSIKDQHFSPGNLSVLIGKNNSGKSNVIDMLNDFKEYFDKPSPGGDWLESRGYKGEEPKISLGFHFVLEQDEHNRILRDLDDKLEMYSKSNNTLREVRAYRNFNSDGTDASNVLIKFDDHWIDAYELEDDDDFPHYFANDLKNVINNSINSWQFIDPFRKPNTKTSPAQVEQMDATGKDLIRALESLRSSPNYDIYESVSDAFVEIMENVEDVRIEYDTASPRNEYTIFVKENGFDKRFKASEISSGTLEILMLLTRLYSADENTDLLAIEEPELHLHPGAEKKIFDILNELISDVGPQVILTTHSEVFVNRSHVDNIVLVTRDKESKFRSVQTGENDHLDILGYNNSDLIQSDAIGFVEGRSDKVILEQFSKKLGKSLSDNNIELIVGHGDQIIKDADPITRVLGQLGIEYKFIFDSDGENPDKKSDKLGDTLNVSPSKIYVFEEYSIESYLMSSPEAIAKSINENPKEIRQFVQKNWSGNNATGVLDDLYRQYLGIGYNKENNGAQIVSHFERDDIDEEIDDLISNLMGMT